MTGINLDLADEDWDFDSLDLRKQIYFAYDSCFALQPNLWGNFIQEALTRDFNVRFVTLRSSASKKENKDIESYAEKLGIDIVYTNKQAKKKFLKTEGYPEADIWFEGVPECIFVAQFTNNKPYYEEHKNVNQLSIGLDFDDTYTIDPVLFDNLIANAIKLRHDIRIVTARKKNINHKFNKDISDVVRKHGRYFFAFFTQHIAKKNYLQNSALAKFMPMIWIDDSPEYILKNRL